MIEKIDIKGTRDTPEILFDPQNNIFTIKGNSMPEDATAFFGPIFNWVEKYIESPVDNTNIICNLEYFNSTSAKMIYQIFIEFEKVFDKDKKAEIFWYFDNGDKLIEEKGFEFQEVLELPFNIIENS